MTKTKSGNLFVMVSLSAALATQLSGCSDPADAHAQRDVYTGPDAVEKCIADWGDNDLCKQRISEEEAKALAAANRSNGSHGGIFIFPYSGYGVYGPSYSGERAVSHNGTTVAPASNKASNVAAFKGTTTTPHTFTKPVGTTARSVTTSSSRTVTTTSRGGFGSTGHASGASS